MLPGDGREVLELHALGEADHLEVARVHLHDGGRAGRDRRGVILGSGAVGGADLNHARAGKAHHVRHPKTAADLDQLATRDDNLLALRHGRQHQEHRRRAIVDNRRPFRARQMSQ